MFRISNNLILLLNFVTLLLSVPILLTGDNLANHASNDCERWLEKPIMFFGLFLFVLSLAGLIGSCFAFTCCLWIYLFIMYLLIMVMLSFTIFVFVITNKGAGEAVSGKGYEEYRLGDYSNWLQRRVDDSKNWNKIKSCLQSAKICSKFQDEHGKDTAQIFYAEHLSSLQSGCCKPSNDCNFSYQLPTVWNKPENASYSNPDCKAWDNNPEVLCFNCTSCKAGLLENLKNDWKKVAIVNITVIILLFIIYSVGCCAYRNDRIAEYHRYYYHRPY